MKVIWTTDIILPEFCKALGLEAPVHGGWLPSLAEAVRNYCPEIELHIVCQGPVVAKKTIYGIHYYSLGPARPSQVWKRAFIRIRPEFIRQLQEVVKSVKPDVVHLHGSEGLFPTLPSECWYNVPRVISLQGIIAGYAPHYMGNILEKELRPHRNRLRELLSRYSVARGADIWLNSRGPKEVEALKSVENIFGRTGWDAAWAHYINPKAKYSTVGEILRSCFYNGMRDENGVIPHSIFCGAAANYPLKGAHWLIRAVGSLKKKYPDVKLVIARAESLNYHWSFKGRLKQSEYHRYLCALLNKYDLWENVEIQGSLSAEGVKEQLLKAEVFCLPSLIENSPNSLGEAMMMGVPSVSTFVGGTPSILENGKEGLLVPSADPAALADAIDKLFTDKALARKYAEAAYTTAVKRYTPETVVAQLKSAYQAIVKTV